MVYPNSIFSSDMLISYLRGQVFSLSVLIETIEANEHYDEQYIKSSLRQIEVEIRQLRKIIEN